MVNYKKASEKLKAFSLEMRDFRISTMTCNHTDMVDYCFDDMNGVAKPIYIKGKLLVIQHKF